MLAFTLILLAALAQSANEADLKDSRERCLTLLNSHQYTVLVREIDALPRDIGDDLFIRLVLGRALFKLEKHQEAFAVFEACVRTNDQLPPFAHLLRAQCALKLGRYKDAWKSFERYEELGPEREDHPTRVALAIRDHAGDPVRGSELVRKMCIGQQETPKCLLWEALLHTMAGDDAMAEAAVSTFLKGDPANVRGLYLRATSRSHLGNDDGAVRDFHALLTVDPMLAGGFDATKVSKAVREPGDMTYGRRQVEAVMRDRPRMGTEFDARNPLHAWVALRFQHRIGDSQIRWSADFRRKDERDLANAYNIRAAGGSHWSVHVSAKDANGTLRTRDELWESLLFELENVSDRHRHAVYDKAAMLGTISKRAFITATTGLESKAEQRTRAFFVQIYYPWCKANGIDVSSAEWRLDGPLTVEDRIATHPPESYYPWTIYGRLYDALRSRGAPQLDDGVIQVK